MPKSKIYFASDQHFGIPDYGSSLEREKKFIEWLDTIEAEASEVFLLGDLFDFWFEYKKVIPKGFVRILGKLAQLVDNGVALHFFVGNHDLWMRDYFIEEIGAKVYSKPQDFTRNGKTFHVAHGDGLGPHDKGYKIMKRIFKSSLGIWLFRWLHPDIGMRIGQHLSKNKSFISGDRNSKFRGRENEWLVKYCEDQQKLTRRDYYVFGHRHLALEIEIDDRSTYITVGEWISLFSYGEFDGEKFHLKFWKQ